MIAATAVVLLASGAKSAVIAMFALGILAFAKQANKSWGVANIGAIVAIIAVTVYLNPNAVDRLQSFIVEDQARDGTREIEVEFARYKLLSGIDKMVIGNGLSDAYRTRNPEYRLALVGELKIRYRKWILGNFGELGVIGTVAYVYMFSFLPEFE